MRLSRLRRSPSARPNWASHSRKHSPSEGRHHSEEDQPCTGTVIDDDDSARRARPIWETTISRTSLHIRNNEAALRHREQGRKLSASSPDQVCGGLRHQAAPSLNWSKSAELRDAILRTHKVDSLYGIMANQFGKIPLRTPGCAKAALSLRTTTRVPHAKTGMFSSYHSGNEAKRF